MEKNPYDLSKLNDRQKKDLESYLFDLMDYFQDRADADFDDGAWIANDEAKMLYNLNNIFGLERY